MTITGIQELELIIGMHYRIPKDYLCSRLGISKDSKIENQEEKNRAVTEYRTYGMEFFDIMHYHSQREANNIKPKEEELKEYREAIKKLEQMEKEKIRNISKLFYTDIKEVAETFNKMQNIRTEYRKEKATRKNS